MRNFAMKREASFRVVNAKFYKKCLRLDAKPLHIEHIYIVYSSKILRFFSSSITLLHPSVVIQVFLNRSQYLYIIYFYFILLYFITFIIIHYIIIIAAASLPYPPTATLVTYWGARVVFIRLHGRQHLIKRLCVYF